MSNCYTLEVVDACVQYWKDHQDSIDISQIEGFVRQVIGWRGIYARHLLGPMPFAEMNYFNHQAKLPNGSGPETPK